MGGRREPSSFPAAAQPPPKGASGGARDWLTVLLCIYLLLVAVGLIAAGFRWVSGGEAAAGNLFRYAQNPFMALVMGSFATALVQSSSTVSSVIVALVAAGMPVATAIPMIMGANVGTTVTNTIVSLGHVNHSREFRRAFAAATIHDFFNLVSVVVFLPVELAFGFLERISAAFVETATFEGSLNLAGLDFVGAVTKPVVAMLARDGLLGAVLPGRTGGAVTIALGIGLIFFSIQWMGRLLKKVMVGRAEKIFHAAVDRGPLAGILAGMLMTILVQSSSTTTSLIVPLAGAGILSLQRVYPFTLGANIGTTVTALLAATAITGKMAAPALQIAVAHLFYNVLGVIVIYSLRPLRAIPVLCAEALAEHSARRRSVAIVYVLGVFFVLPVSLIGISSAVSPAEPPVREVRGVSQEDVSAAEEEAKELSERSPSFAVE